MTRVFDLPCRREDRNLLLLVSCRCRFQIFLNSELDDLRYQFIGDRFVQGELYRTLAKRINRQFLLELLDSRGYGIKADVFFEGGEVDQVPFQRNVGI